jgi:phosphatidylglycerophosphatase A
MTSGLSPLGNTLITTFGLGYLRPAPGTWGSMPPVLLAGVLVALGHGNQVCPVGLHGCWVYNAAIVATLLLFSFACVAFGDAAEARFGKKDPGHVCADETAGVCIPLLFLPPEAYATPVMTAMTLALVFLAFRIFDILKLPPANGLQRVPGGWGILLDDLVAGVQALVVVQVVVRLCA